MDAAKVAFALAVNRGCESTPVEGVSTIWNVGSFDDGGDLKALVQYLFPRADAPYRVLESLMNAGFGLLGAEITMNPGVRIEDIIKIATQSPEPQDGRGYNDNLGT